MECRAGQCVGQDNMEIVGFLEVGLTNIYQCICIVQSGCKLEFWNYMTNIMWCTLPSPIDSRWTPHIPHGNMDSTWTPGGNKFFFFRIVLWTPPGIHGI